MGELKSTSLGGFADQFDSAWAKYGEVNMLLQKALDKDAYCQAVGDFVRMVEEAERSWRVLTEPGTAPLGSPHSYTRILEELAKPERPQKQSDIDTSQRASAWMFDDCRTGRLAKW